MNVAIIDTDVVSMPFKGESRAEQYRFHIRDRLLGISFMTLAELERWPLERNWGISRKSDLPRHLTKYTALPVNRELCAKWAEVSLWRPAERPPYADRGCLDRGLCASLSSAADHERR